MRRAGVDDAGIERVLDQLRRHGLVDDESFAAYWVEQRQSFRPRGGRLVRAELARLGVGRTEAESATAELRGTAEHDAYRAAARFASRLRGLDETNFTRRLAQWLARRGFDWDTVSIVVKRLAEENAVDTS